MGDLGAMFAVTVEVGGCTTAHNAVEMLTLIV